MANQYTDTTQITRAQEYQLVGLLTLARKRNAELRDLERAAAAIVGEDPDGLGHTGDVVYSAEGDLATAARDLLAKLEIKVVP